MRLVAGSPVTEGIGADPGAVEMLRFGLGAGLKSCH
jgi:hypothetical protein